jgi:hypothetical protein
MASSRAHLNSSTRPIIAWLSSRTWHISWGCRSNIGTTSVHTYTRPCICMYAHMNAYHGLGSAQRRAARSTSISIAEIFMAINRRTWPRPVNYVRRSTDYDAAPRFSRETSPRDRRRRRCLVDANFHVEKKKSRENVMALFPFLFSTRRRFSDFLFLFKFQRKKITREKNSCQIKNVSSFFLKNKIIILVDKAVFLLVCFLKGQSTNSIISYFKRKVFIMKLSHYSS